MRRALCFVLLVVLASGGCRVEPSAEASGASSGFGGSQASAAESPNDDGALGGSGGRGGGRSSSGGANGGSGATTSSAPAPSGASSLSEGDAGAFSEDPAEGGAGSSARPAPGGDDTAPVTVCDAQAVTFDELGAGEVRKNARVTLDAVATSQKFLLSHAHSGSCLFGAFVGAEPDQHGPRGILVVSYGEDAAEDEPCAPDRDGIPVALAAGDGVSVVGTLTSYAPSTCSGVVPSPQLMVDVGCPLSRTGRRVQPAPFDLSPERASALALGKDSALLGRFAGGLVRLQGVSAARPEDGTGSVGPYGVIRFLETSLELHNDLEYGDLTLAGPGDAHKSLVFGYPKTFSSISGLVYLDFCTWSLAPRSRCDDLAPPSENCP